MSIPYVYDSGALIALDRNDRRMWARHQLALDDGRDIHVPSVVVGQAWRDDRRQVRLGKVLATCIVEPVGREHAKASGALCGKAGTSDLIDAIVVTTGASLGAVIWTSDHDDIKRLADETGVRRALVIRSV